jgi:hypothetical protein
MPKPPNSWKYAERRIAKIFGGERRGAYVSDGKSGKNDIIKDGWSIEVKLLSRPTFQQMFDACLQAESNAESEMDIPVAVVKKKGMQYKDSLVIMRLEKFEEFFINE